MAQGPFMRPAVAIALAGPAASAALHLGSIRPLGLWPLAWVALVPWFLSLRHAGPLSAAAGGFLGGVLWMGLGMSWLRHVGWPALAGTALVTGLWTALFGLLARRACRPGALLPPGLALPCLWVGVEWLRATPFFTACPWMQLGHSQARLPLLVQVADLGGVYLVGLLVACGSGIAVAALRPLPPGPAARPGRMPGGARGPLALGLALGAALAYGAWRPGTVALEAGPTVGAVQCNVPQDLKESGESRDAWAIYHELVDLTRKLPAGRHDLVVWPETMVHPELLDFPEVRSELAALVRERGPLLLGAFHRERRGEGEVYHNSAVLVGGEGQATWRYDKARLMPAAEYIPLAGTPLFRFLKWWVPEGFVVFEPGPGARVLEVSGRRYAPSICYDLNFGPFGREAVAAGAEVLVCISNDAWFQDSSELELARDMAVFRAVETRRAIARVVNTGISAAYDPLGRVTVLADASGRSVQVAASGRFELLTSRGRTVYAVVGDAFAMACLVAGLAAAFARRRPG